MKDDVRRSVPESRPRIWAAVFMFGISGCTAVTGAPRDVIDPTLPEIELRMKYLSVGGEEVEPLLVKVSLDRLLGEYVPHQDSHRLSTTLASTLASGGIARLPQYVPERGQDSRLFAYHIAVTFYMADTIECVIYHRRDGLLVGPASVSGRWKFPIGPDGRVELEVPFRRIREEYPPLSDEARLLERIHGTREDMKGESRFLKRHENRLIAQWALSRLDELGRIMGETGEINELRRYWSDLKSAGGP